MTHQTGSLMSSPVSISGVESLDSDIESTLSIREDKGVLGQRGIRSPNIVYETPRVLGSQIDSGDGDLHLLVCRII